MYNPWTNIDERCNLLSEQMSQFLALERIEIMNNNMMPWNKVVEAYPTPSRQVEADTAISVYLSSCEHDHDWIPSIEEWCEMIERSKALIITAGFVFDLKACVQALSGWFWRYHWRDLDRELFKQYAIVLASHFGGDISAVMNALWDEVLEDTESGDPALKSTAPLLRHLMNVSEIEGCRIHPSRQPH
nr:hypothetical protein [uncultured archaeon]